jgi:hypothetical protein
MHSYTNLLEVCFSSGLFRPVSPTQNGPPALTRPKVENKTKIENKTAAKNNTEASEDDNNG